MSTQVKQIVFIGLAVVLIGFMVVMLRPQGGPATPSGSLGGPAAVSSGLTGGQSQVDSGVAQRISALQEQVLTNPKDVDKLIELGGLLFEAQQFARSADVYNRVLDLDPRNNDARVELGKAYFWQGMTSTAIKEFRNVIAADPKKVESRYQLALALSHSERPDIESAIVEWKEVIKLAPDSELGKKSQSFIDSYQKQK